MSAQHTPGPMFALGHSVHPDRQGLLALSAIAVCKSIRRGPLRISPAEAAANARLFAAAPEMYEALKSALTEEFGWKPRVRAAIAKANGAQP